MRIGLFVGALPTRESVQEQVTRVVDAERSGFDSFWFAQTGETDILTTIALAGTETERIELGTGVIPTYTRHPNVLAQQAATVNQAAGGRLALGIGPSHRPGVERLGLAYDRPARHTREYVEILRALSTAGRVDHDGEYFQLASAIGLAGAEPYPILVSALGSLMLKVAGEVADGTVTWMADAEAIGSHVVPRLNAAALDAGREVPRVVAGVPIAVHDDAEEARRAAGETYGGYGRLANYQRILERGSAGGPAEAAAVGSEDDVAQQLGAYVEAGVTDLVGAIFPVGDDPVGSTARTTEFLSGLVETI